MRKLGLMIVSLAFLAVAGFANEGGEGDVKKEQPTATASNDHKKVDLDSATAEGAKKKKEEKKKPDHKKK